MELNEKQIIELAEKIYESFFNLSMGKEPGLLSGSVYKNLDTHPKFMEMLQTCKDFFNQFDGKINEIPEWENLAKFRLKLVDLYLQK